MSGAGYSPPPCRELLVRGVLKADQTIQAIVIALGCCSLEFDSKTPMAEDTILLGQRTWRKQVDTGREASPLLSLSRKVLCSLLGEQGQGRGSHQESYSVVNLVGMAKYAHEYSSGTNVMGVTNHSLIGLMLQCIERNICLVLYIWPSLESS